MKTINYKINCKNCGAPVTTEICPFCNSPTGLDTASANMEHPVLECKPAIVDFWSVGFPAIFAVSFGFFGFIFPFIFLSIGGYEFGTIFLICIPFMMVGAVSAFFVVRRLGQYFTIKAKGKKISAIVYGYLNDDVIINGLPGQVVKLLVETPHGSRFILYKTGKTTQPYGINTTIDLLVYKDLFLICKNTETVFDD